MNKNLMTEPQGYDLLSRNGIPVPEFRVAHSADEAAAAAQKIGLPVVLKVVSPQVVHKSDAGGVLFVRQEDEVRTGYKNIIEKVEKNVPEATIQGIIVEKMMPPGLALPYQCINATFDPVTPPSGTLAFVSQSGATITTLVDWSLQAGRGFSAIISVGNQADLRFDDFLQFLNKDSKTKGIILYIEEIMDGPLF